MVRSSRGAVAVSAGDGWHLSAQDEPGSEEPVSDDVTMPSRFVQAMAARPLLDR
ncbi:hypothetical protein EDD29_5121 [Actinocorallia herbida]|uniref:Uncharacterized protein n=1 Tax=Actinocorallia herbida TaxID=58109 RepID=A0A3N1D1U9_9ACTN|nr:hypothetical protein [Actinocorallia herbida]ROO87513.1 hypothetical protein EDD29_5121 [Actinocorallia herbida]